MVTIFPALWTFFFIKHGGSLQPCSPYGFSIESSSPIASVALSKSYEACTHQALRLSFGHLCLLCPGNFTYLQNSERLPVVPERFPFRLLVLTKTRLAVRQLT